MGLNLNPIPECFRSCGLRVEGQHQGLHLGVAGAAAAVFGNLGPD